MPDPGGDFVLELRDVSKAFGAVVALESASLQLAGGSIHALVGENGAGKSTLVKIVSGVHHRDGGEILLGGESVDFGSTAESKAAGIAVIYQEPTLFPDLSVTENLFMGRQALAGGRRTARGARGGPAAVGPCSARRSGCSRGGACPSAPGAPQRACPSPTSRSSRSPR